MKRLPTMGILVIATSHALPRISTRESALRYYRTKLRFSETRTSANRLRQIPAVILLHGAVVDCSGSLPDRYRTDLMALPPLLIVHNQDDPVIPIFNATQLQNLRRTMTLSCQSQIGPSGGHAFKGKSATLLTQAILAFLSDKLLLSNCARMSVKP